MDAWLILLPLFSIYPIIHRVVPRIASLATEYETEKVKRWLYAAGCMELRFYLTNWPPIPNRRELTSHRVIWQIQCGHRQQLLVHIPLMSI